MYYDADGGAHTVGHADPPSVRMELFWRRTSALPTARSSFFLENTYVTSSPDRIAKVFQVVQLAPNTHENIDPHLHKTKAWNAAGEGLPGLRGVVGGATFPPEQDPRRSVLAELVVVIVSLRGHALQLHAGLLPDTTLDFAQRHDAAVVRCLADLMANDEPLHSTRLRCDWPTCCWPWAGWASVWLMADTLPTGPGPKRGGMLMRWRPYAAS